MMPDKLPNKKTGVTGQRKTRNKLCVHVCVYVYVCVCVFMSVRMCVRAWSSHMYAQCAHVCVYMYVCVWYVFAHVPMVCAFGHVCMCLCLCVCEQSHMH